jgi:hypothetical protein
VDRVLRRTLACWERFMAEQVELDAVRDAVRAAAGALDGAEAACRTFLDVWSLDLDGTDTRMTRFGRIEDARGAVQQRSAERVLALLDHFAQHNG